MVGIFPEYGEIRRYRNYLQSVVDLHMYLKTIFLKNYSFAILYIRN